MIKNTILLIFTLIFFSISATSSYTQDGHEGHNHSGHAKFDKKFYIHGGIKMHFDTIAEAHEKNEEVDESYTHSHIEMGYNLNKNFSLLTDIKIEGESGGHSHGEATVSKLPEDKFFDDHKLFIDKLILSYSTDVGITLYGGKFAPSVGLDYHAFPGIWGYQKIEEYAIVERLGYGIALKQNFEDLGTHKLNVSTFFKDNTSLSNSVITDRGKTKKSDGGVSNTQDFSSYAISIEGKDFFSLSNNFVDGLSYKVGHAKQSKAVKNLGSNSANSSAINDNVNLTHDEKRSSISLVHKSIIAPNLSMRILTEFMKIEHFTGEESHDRDYITTGLDFYYKKINVGGTYTQETNEAAEADEAIDDKVYQVSLGYLVNNNLHLHIGYKKADEANEIKHTVGAMIAYYFDM
ncbi:hypothetical protein HN460_00370 [bacterium]|jgi:hypothetical protein|nr:hypothetical protein [bacterium]MBT3795155.1 hypothetical protein [bacterium]MBT4634955.1 hypothetical protein [bacterium]